MDAHNPLIVSHLLQAQSLLSERHWEDFREGVKISRLYQLPSGAQAALLHYQPGARVPLHTHSGLEHIFILHGAQSDQNHHYPAGTLVIHPEGSSHAIYSEKGCIALGIWLAPVVF